MKHFLLSIAVVLALSLNAQVQPTLIFEGNSRTPNETTFAINPSNVAQQCAAANLDLVCWSSDSGKTWDSQNVSSEFGFYGDPVLIADDAVLYILHLSDPAGKNWGSPSFLDRIVVQYSLDFGATWSKGCGIGLNGTKDQDKPWATIHPKTKDLVISWTEFDKYGSIEPENQSRILFSTFSLENDTCSVPTQVSNTPGFCLDNDRANEGAVPIVDDNGDILVFWRRDNTLWMNTSEDGGLTWGRKDKKVFEEIAEWDFTVPGFHRANGFPTVEKLGRKIALLWSDQKDGEDNTNIRLSILSKKKKKFSEPITISPHYKPLHQFFPILKTDNKSGNVYVHYYHQPTKNSKLTIPMLARSKDGGNSFEHFILNEEGFMADSTFFLGDYIGLDVQQGIIRPVWMELHDKKQSIWTSLLTDKMLDNWKVQED